MAEEAEREFGRPFILSDFAGFEGVEVVRAGEFERTGLVGSRLPGTLSYAASARYLSQAAANPNICCLIVTPKLASSCAGSGGLVIHRCPAELFFDIHNKLAAWQLAGEACDEPLFAETALVHPAARIEPGCTIGAGVVVEAGATIFGGSVIEADVYIGPGVMIGIEGHFFKRFGDRLVRLRHVGGVRVGRGTHIMARALIQRAVFDGETAIGTDVVIGPGAHVGHGVHIGDRTTLAGSAQLAGYSTIGRDVWIGPGAVIADRLTIADGARVEIGSVVVKSVGEGRRVSGNFAVPHDRTLRAYGRTMLLP